MFFLCRYRYALSEKPLRVWIVVDLGLPSVCGYLGNLFFSRPPIIRSAPSTRTCIRSPAELLGLLRVGLIGKSHGDLQKCLLSVAEIA